VSAPSGEWLSIPERLMIAPTWGRFHAEPIDVGQSLRVGAVVGHVAENGHRMQVTSHVAGDFAGWLVRNGERVHPGMALALVRLNGVDGTSGNE
jgi:hypothetical protein